jgi:acetyl-CoA carboxylase carboxyl transferase subunit alpha
MLDYVNHCFKNFLEIHGDRAFRDDPPVVCGFAELEGEKVLVIGQQKGRNTTEKIRRNFGMANPEGYRKALRVMKLAEKFRLPVITFIDTPGAFPGIGAEERGQSEAIARNLLEMAHLQTPILVAVLGEGGSGGALALGVGDEILMMEYAIYSVISPEGCASILWRDTARAETAAEMMKITAVDLKKFGVVDRIVPEPLGGAHRDHKAAADALKVAMVETLSALRSFSLSQLLDRRYAKFRDIGLIKRKAGSGG